VSDCIVFDRLSAQLIRSFAVNIPRAQLSLRAVELGSVMCDKLCYFAGHQHDCLLEEEIEMRSPHLDCVVPMHVIVLCSDQPTPAAWQLLLPIQFRTL
jgi:hypothetical protein